MSLYGYGSFEEYGEYAPRNDFWVDGRHYGGMKHALDESGESVHVDDVENGLACGCTCPVCEENMVAKNEGLIQSHHFAHPPRSCCPLTMRSSADARKAEAHLMAARIFKLAERMRVPKSSFRRGKISAELSSEFVEVAGVTLEKRFGRKVPDILVTTADGEKIFFEIRLCKRDAEAKWEKIRDAGIPSVELDLSWTKRDIGEDWLRDFLTSPRFDENALWVCPQPNSVYVARCDAFMEELALRAASIYMAAGHAFLPPVSFKAFDRDDVSLPATRIPISSAMAYGPKVRVRVRDGREFVVFFVCDGTYRWMYRRRELEEAGVPAFLAVIARKRCERIFFFSETTLREILLTGAVASHAVWAASNARVFYEKLHADEAPEGFVPSAESSPEKFNSFMVYDRVVNLLEN